MRVWDEEASMGTGLQAGDEVDIWPVETGFRHKDRGRLVKLDGAQMVIERTLGQGGAGVLRIHCPRHGFKVKKVTAVAAL
jgi:hypothetical protein